MGATAPVIWTVARAHQRQMVTTVGLATIYIVTSGLEVCPIMWRTHLMEMAG